jgi:hypothetical protein
VRARAWISRVSSHQPQRQPEPLCSHAPNPRNDPQRDRRQCLPRRCAVMTRRTPLQPWSPERRAVDRDRLIPTVLMRLPQPLRLDHPRPRLHQPVTGPAPAPQRRPRPPDRPRRQPHGTQPGDDRSARQQCLPRQQHPDQVHQPQIRPNREIHHQRTHQPHHPVHCLLHRAARPFRRVSTPRRYRTGRLGCLSLPRPASRSTAPTPQLPETRGQCLVKIARPEQ